MEGQQDGQRWKHMIYEEWLRKVGHFIWEEEVLGEILLLSFTTHESMSMVGAGVFSKVHSERLVGSGPKL